LVLAFGSVYICTDVPALGITLALELLPGLVAALASFCLVGLASALYWLPSPLCSGGHLPRYWPT